MLDCDSVVDVLGEWHDVNVKELELQRIIKTIDGKLIIKFLSNFPSISCHNSNCYDFATYMIILLTDTGGQFISYLCEKHLEDTIEMSRQEVAERLT